MPLFMGLDVGTQATKAVVYDDEARRVVARASEAYGMLDGGGVPGRAEQDPAWWIDACGAVVRRAMEGIDHERVKGLGVSGQQHGLVALDADGHVVRPAKLWCDTESAPQAEELSAVLGFTLVPGFTASKILFVKQREPANFARTASVLLPHDYVNFWLTGEAATECGDASGTGLFDAARRDFDPQAARAIDERVPEMLPRLLGPGEALGTIRPEVAQRLGLSPDTVVAPGSGDNACSALGAGAVRDGLCVLSLGTSGTLFGCSSAPVVDPTGVVCGFCDATGAWLPLVCTMSCTGPLEELRRAFRMDHEELTALAEEEQPGCGGANFLPYLGGERTPNWPHATGAILGIRTGGLRPGALYRAAMEGATFTLMGGMQRFTESGFRPKELRLVGGGSKNRLWRRIVADAFQLPLRFPVEAESAALGAALQAGAVHSGTAVASYVERVGPELDDCVVAPDPSKKEVYKAAFQRHKEFGQALFGH
eukprot:evm.model.scf_876.5 EVM.evm.TU.scf_876.5   scf_876:25056-26697(-)